VQVAVTRNITASPIITAADKTADRWRSTVWQVLIGNSLLWAGWWPPALLSLVYCLDWDLRSASIRLVRMSLILVR
jgi:hypothetical protein